MYVKVCTVQHIGTVLLFVIAGGGPLVVLAVIDKDTYELNFIRFKHHHSLSCHPEEHLGR